MVGNSIMQTANCDSTVKVIVRNGFRLFLVTGRLKKNSGFTWRSFRNPIRNLCMYWDDEYLILAHLYQLDIAQQDYVLRTRGSLA